MPQPTMILSNMSMSTISDRLHAAREAMKRVAYQNKFMAMDPETGKACSPKQPKAMLSLRGAIIRVSRNSDEASQLFGWMEYHHILPRAEPALKEEALTLLHRGKVIASQNMMAAL